MKNTVIDSFVSMLETLNVDCCPNFWARAILAGKKSIYVTDTSGSLLATIDFSIYCLYVLQGLRPTSMLKFACRVNFGVRNSYVLGARVVSQYVSEH